MRWCPTTVKVQTDNPKSASGLYLYDELSNTEAVVTLSGPMAEELKLTRGRALVALEVSLDRVLWEDVTLSHEGGLETVNSRLADLKHDFEFLPEGDVVALVFGFAGDNGIEERKKLARNVFFVDSKVNKKKVRIQSSPLAGFHTPLFHGYQSSGVISLVRDEFICLDLRYLDGMEGGTVSGTGLNDGSIGLVAGSLIKTNGQGRLTIVVPWHSIVQSLPQWQMLQSQLSAPVPVDAEWSGVVVVQLKLKGNRVSWGSGVLIGPDLVVTNNHVVSPEYLSLQVWLERRYPYSVAAVSQPIQGLDLVFLKLGRHVPGKFKPVPLAASDPGENTPVESRGYGLFLPQRHGGALQPLSSEGIINRAVDGMLISSAGCWNGSSGGALLNGRHELVGVLASNARDNISGEIIPELSFVIPVSVVRRALNRLQAADATTFADTTSPQFQKLWKLQKTHRDVRRSLIAKSRM